MQKGKQPAPIHESSLQSSLLRASKETLNLWRDRKARLILIANFLLVVGSGITWLAVPWFLIQEPNGNAVYGLSSSALTLLIFLLLPFLGKAIDRNSRKKVLLGYYAFALVTNLFVIAMILLLALRIVFEERFLRGKLPGYEAYMRKVRYRLIPWVW